MRKMFLVLVAILLFVGTLAAHEHKGRYYDVVCKDGSSLLFRSKTVYKVKEPGLFRKNWTFWVVS